MFDFDAAFDEFTALFRTRAFNKTVARTLWDRLVCGPDEEAAACHKMLMEGLPAGARDATPEWALRKVFGAKLPAAEPPPRVLTAKTAKVATTTKPDGYSAFREIWGTWPQDPTRRRESESVAKAAWDQAVARHGLAAVRDACLDIARDEARLVHRRNLSTVLTALVTGEEDVRATRPLPSEADMLEFSDAYRWYPQPMEDAQEAFDLWLAFVQPDGRLMFLAAVREYADARAGEDPGYTKSWANFLNGEWRALGDVRLTRAVYEVAGIDDDDLRYFDREAGRWVEFEAPDGSVEQVVAALIEFVNARRRRPFEKSSCEEKYFRDPITKTAPAIIEEARQLLATPPAAEEVVDTAEF